MNSHLWTLKIYSNEATMAKGNRVEDMVHRTELCLGRVEQEGPLGPWWRETDTLVVGIILE